MGRTCAQTAAAISSPNRLYTRAQGSMPCTMCLVAWHTAGILANGCLSPNKVYGICWCHFLAVLALILLDTTVSEYYSMLSKCTILLNITDITQYYSILLILLTIVQYYSILLILLNITCQSDPGVILRRTWILLSVSNVTQYYEYYEYYTISPVLLIYPILLILPLLQTELIGPGYYSVLPILLSITNITQYYQYY